MRTWENTYEQVRLMAEKLPASGCDEVVVVPGSAARKVDHSLGICVVELGLKCSGKNRAEFGRREPRPLGGARIQNRPVGI